MIQRRLPHGLLLRQASCLDLPAEPSYGPQLRELSLHEAKVTHGPVAGHDWSNDEFQQARRRTGPIERECVAEVQGFAGDEVAREEDSGIGSEGDDVGVGMATAEISHFDGPASHCHAGRVPDEEVRGIQSRA